MKHASPCIISLFHFSKYISQHKVKAAKEAADKAALTALLEVYILHSLSYRIGYNSACHLSEAGTWRRFYTGSGRSLPHGLSRCAAAGAPARAVSSHAAPSLQAQGRRHPHRAPTDPTCPTPGALLPQRRPPRPHRRTAPSSQRPRLCKGHPRAPPALSLSPSFPPPHAGPSRGGALG